MDTLKLFTQLYKRSIELWEYGFGIHSHPNYSNKLVLGPSSTHACPRKVILGALFGAPHGMKRQSEATMVGTAFHDKMDRLMDMALWALGGEIVRLNCFRLTCLETDTCEVAGTSDHVFLILSVSRPQLVMLDWKHPKEYAVTKAKKGDVSTGYLGQLAMYARGLVNSPVGALLDLQTVNDMDVALFQVSRNNYRNFNVTPVENLAFHESQAMAYWGSVITQIDEAREKMDLTEGREINPFADTQILGGWQCNYCNWNHACKPDGETALDVMPVKDIEAVKNSVGFQIRDADMDSVDATDIINIASTVSHTIDERRRANE